MAKPLLGNPLDGNPLPLSVAAARLGPLADYPIPVGLSHEKIPLDLLPVLSFSFVRQGP